MSSLRSKLVSAESRGDGKDSLRFRLLRIERWKESEFDGFDLKVKNWRWSSDFKLRRF